MRKFLGLLLMSVFFCGCVNSEIEEKFNEISENVIKGDHNEVIESFDEESLEYVQKLVDLSVGGDEEKILYFALEKEYPITTIILHDQLEEIQKTWTLEEKQSRGIEMMKFIIMFNGIGIFRSSSEYPIRFEEVEAINGKYANVSALVPTGSGKLIKTTYRFTKEDDKWKINFLSTLKMMEKIYGQDYKRSWTSYFDYAEHVNSGKNEEIRFQYQVQ